MTTQAGIIEGVKEVVPMEGTMRERLLAFHKQGVTSAEMFFADTVAFEANTAILSGQPWSPREFAQRLREARVEDGSIYAAFRDKLAFHRAAVEFIERLPA
jgi:hypothetical protein